MIPKLSPAFLRFVAIGGLASLVNLIARIAINRMTSYEVAIVGAFFVALVTAFELNRAFVFNDVAGRWWPRFGRFLVVNLVALVQVFVISVTLARFIFPRIGMTLHPDIVAHGIGLLSPLFTSFWLHRRFTFAGSATAR